MTRIIASSGLINHSQIEDRSSLVEFLGLSRGALPVMSSLDRAFAPLGPGPKFGETGVDSSLWFRTIWNLLNRARDLP